MDAAESAQTSLLQEHVQLRISPTDGLNFTLSKCCPSSLSFYLSDFLVECAKVHAPEADAGQLEAMTHHGDVYRLH